jgi:hypothetical protein
LWSAVVGLASTTPPHLTEATQHFPQSRQLAAAAALQKTTPLVQVVPVAVVKASTRQITWALLVLREREARVATAPKALAVAALVVVVARAARAATLPAQRLAAAVLVALVRFRARPLPTPVAAAAVRKVAQLGRVAPVVVPLALTTTAGQPTRQ